MSRRSPPWIPPWTPPVTTPAPQPDPIEARRRDYALVLVKLLELRWENGEFDEELADRIERVLGLKDAGAAGEAEYASWQHAASSPLPQERQDTDQQGSTP